MATGTSWVCVVDQAGVGNTLRGELEVISKKCPRRAEARWTHFDSGTGCGIRRADFNIIFCSPGCTAPAAITAQSHRNKSYARLNEIRRRIRLESRLCALRTATMAARGAGSLADAMGSLRLSSATVRVDTINVRSFCALANSVRCRHPT